MPPFSILYFQFHSLFTMQVDQNIQFFLCWSWFLCWKILSIKAIYDLHSLKKIYFTKMMWSFSGGGIVNFLLSCIFALLIIFSALSARCLCHVYFLYWCHFLRFPWLWRILAGQAVVASNLWQHTNASFNFNIIFIV